MRALLYGCALYNFVFLGFLQWGSHTDRVLTLKMNIRLEGGDFHCFGGLKVGSGAQTQPHVWAWLMGVFAAIVSLGAKVTKVPTHCFSLNCQKYLAHSEGFSNLTP